MGEMRIFGVASAVPPHYRALEANSYDDNAQDGPMQYANMDIGGGCLRQDMLFQRAYGVCKEWCGQHGYIESIDSGQAVYVHSSNLLMDAKMAESFKAGLPVSFQHGAGDATQPQAILVAGLGTQEEDLVTQVFEF